VGPTDNPKVKVDVTFSYHITPPPPPTAATERNNKIKALVSSSETPHSARLSPSLLPSPFPPTLSFPHLPPRNRTPTRQKKKEKSRAKPSKAEQSRAEQSSIKHWDLAGLRGKGAVRGGLWNTVEGWGIGESGKKEGGLLDELDGGRARLASKGSYLFARAYSYRHRYKLFTIQPPK